MRVAVQKWGNSLALRIPKMVAQNANIKQGSIVDLSVAGGRLVVSPFAEEPVTLRQMLKGVRRSNLHGEVDVGPAVGREGW